MTLRNQVLVWGGLLLMAVLLLWVFRSILLPFVVGMALAYLLNPIVNLLQRIRIPRSFGSALVLVLVIAVITGLVLMLVPLVSTQVAGLVPRSCCACRPISGTCSTWCRTWRRSSTTGWGRSGPRSWKRRWPG